MSRASTPSLNTTVGNVLLLLVLIVLAFALDIVLPLERLGLRPREIDGLFGIAAMPFLHASFSHLCSNLVPLAVLMALLSLTVARPMATALAIALLSGLLTWLFARSGNHVGASGLVFGLASCLIAGGYRARSLTAFVIAAVTLFLYGTTLLVGVLPSRGAVSWDGHLAGAIAGLVVARFSARNAINI